MARLSTCQTLTSYKISWLIKEKVAGSDHLQTETMDRHKTTSSKLKVLQFMLKTSLIKRKQDSIGEISLLKVRNQTQTSLHKKLLLFTQML